jgi:hypothetical protein
MHVHRMTVGALGLAGALLTMGCPKHSGGDAGSGDASSTDAGAPGPNCSGSELVVDDGRPSAALDTCVRPPLVEAELCNIMGEEFCDGALAPGTSPRLAGCVVETAGMAAGAPVTMRGVVDLFGEGNDTLGTTVTVYLVDDVNGAAVAGPVTAGMPCTMPEDPAAPPSGAECAPGVWCLTIPAGDFCGAAEDPAAQVTTPVGTGPENSFKSYYEIPSVPTGTSLVAKVVRGTAQDLLVDTYQYDVFLMDEGGGVDDQEVNIITYAAYITIPSTTVVGMVPAGHGSVAGTIHDCDDLRIGNASVGFSTTPGVIAYFNGVFGDPTPDPSRVVGTNIDGIYAGLDLPAGLVRLQAQALVGGTVTNVGGFDLEVFPDSVTLLTLRGRSYTP